MGDTDPSLITESTPEELHSDLIYSVLSDKRRRYLIHYLKQNENSVSLRELAEQVAAWENNKSINEITSKERKRVYIALYQSHLPTLDKQGIVDYDSDTGMVSLSDAMVNRDIYIEIVPKGSIPWGLYYIGLVLASSIVLGLVWFNVFPFDQLADLLWGVLILIMFSVSALIQTYQLQRMQFGDKGPPPEINENYSTDDNSPSN